MREIRADPEAHALCIAHAGDLARACEPCGDAVVNAALTRLAAVYGVPWDDETQMAVAKEAYFDALRDLPAEAIPAGVRAYEKGELAVHFPRPGPLGAACRPFADALRTAAYRARRACELAPIPKGPRTEAERLAMLEAIQGLKSEIGKRAQVSSSPRISPHGGRHAMAASIRAHADTLEAQTAGVEEFI